MFIKMYETSEILRLFREGNFGVNVQELFTGNFHNITSL
jgi:hypothetical protein